MRQSILVKAVESLLLESTPAKAELALLLPAPFPFGKSQGRRAKHPLAAHRLVCLSVEGLPLREELQ